MSPRDTDQSSETQRIGVGGAVAAALVLVCGVVIAWSALSLLSAALVETPAVLGSERPGEAGDEDRLALYVDQFNGRSMFFTPAEPPPVRIPLPINNTGPKVDAAPTRYGGPGVIGMANDTVWFSDKRQAKVGGEAVGDLRVLSTDGAWQILVEWKGVEFEVPFMIRDEYVLPLLPESERAGGDAGSEIAAAPFGEGSGSSDVRSDATEETEQENPGSRDNSQSGDEQ